MFRIGKHTDPENRSLPRTGDRNQLLMCLKSFLCTMNTFWNKWQKLQNLLGTELYPLQCTNVSFLLGHRDL